MADLSDVVASIVALIDGTVYPLGSSQAPVGGPARIMGGWPSKADFDAALRAGISIISVFPMDADIVTTRYPRDWQDKTLGTPTIAALASGLTITLSGTVTVGNYVTATVRGKPYSYAAVVGSTLSSIAAALAALINVDTPATAGGSVITMNAVASGRISVVAKAPGTVSRELRRQQKIFKITIHAPTNDARIALAGPVDVALAETDNLSLPDGSANWMTFNSSFDVDGAEVNSVFRRDLNYRVEYGTTQETPGYPITSTPISITPVNSIS